MKIVYFSAALALVSAHFTLDEPTSRGFSEDLESQAPCGGYTTVNNTRTVFPITRGSYQIDSHHAQAVVSVTFSGNGQTFSTTPYQQYTMTGLGLVCAQLGSLTDFKSGDNVTMQVVYKATSEDKPLYQCADLMLTDTKVNPVVCSNATSVTISGLRTGHVAVSSVVPSGSETSGVSAPSATTAPKVSGSTPSIPRFNSKTVVVSIILTGLGALVAI